MYNKKNILSKQLSSYQTFFLSETTTYSFKSKKTSSQRANSETITNLFSVFLSSFLFRFSHLALPEITRWWSADSLFPVEMRRVATVKFRFNVFADKLLCKNKESDNFWTNRSFCFDEKICLRFSLFYSLFIFFVSQRIAIDKS